MSDPREREPEPVTEPPVDVPVEDGDDDDEDDLTARRANRAHCGRLYGYLPCISILAADEETVVETRECDTWCPVLKKPV